MLFRKLHKNDELRRENASLIEKRDELLKEHCANQEVIKALEKEVRRLSELISGKTKDCAMGSWCDDCRYLGQDRAFTPKNTDYLLYHHISPYIGKVRYCKKHIYDICQEFEERKK